MAERKVDIRDNSRRPENEAVTASLEQIEAWLNATSPLEVHDRGMSYGLVAKTIRAVAEALPQVGKDLTGAWRSGNSAKAQKALQLLNASGKEIADAMDKMAEALTLYGADYLPEAIEEVQAAKAPKLSNPKLPLLDPNLPPATAPPTLSANGEQPLWPLAGTPGLLLPADNLAAQRALEKLNGRIVSLYDFKIPESVVVDLPEISPADGPAPERDMPLTTHDPYQKGTYWDGSGTTGSSDPSRSSGSPGTHGSPGTDGTDRSTGSDRSSGSPGSKDSSDPAPGDTPGTDTPGDDTTPGGQDPGSSPKDPGTTGDGTTPPVIDNSTTEDQTTRTPDATPQDPRSTESAGYQPPATTPAYTATPTANPPVNPTRYPTPTSSSPAVIGGPGSYTQGGVPMAASRAAGAAGAGMPFMPLGGAGGGQQEPDIELPSLLQEDRDVWNPGEGSTSPVIG